MDTCSWKLTGEANSTTHHVDVLWLTVKIIKHPTTHNTSEVGWDGHDPNPNHVHESLLSEVDWGAHHPSVFLFLVNIDYDAKPIEFFIQGLWGEPQHRTPYIPLIGPQTDSLATGQSFLAMVIQLQWLVVLGRLVTHTQVTT